MKTQLPIKQKFQNPKEAFCGPITFCAITNKNPSNLKAIHEKARIKPSIGFFYASFLKLSKKITAHIEKDKGPSSKKFEIMWKFEEPFQKISKGKFIKQLTEKTKKLDSAYRSRINKHKKLNPKILKKIIIESLKKGKPIGVMIMENINKHTKSKGTFLIPHWITIHGIKKDKFLVYNSYLPKSKWINQKDILKKISSVRNQGFTPQIITLS